MEHLSSGFMGEPRGHLNAAANSWLLAAGPVFRPANSSIGSRACERASKRTGVHWVNESGGGGVPLTRYSYGEWGSVVTEIRSCASVVLPHLRQQTNGDVSWGVGVRG